MSKIGLLIVDEHSAVRNALGIRLSSSPNIDVLAVTGHLDQGVAYACALKPDVILLEPKMVDGNGRSPAVIVAEMSRKLANSRPPAVIVLTSYIDETEREAVIQAGARRYLLKDIDSERLIAEIEAVANEDPAMNDPPPALEKLPAPEASHV